MVTGAFHTPRLVEVLLDGADPEVDEVKMRPVRDTGSFLIRYSYEQLDALNGYGAGMPSPWWYDQCYRHRQTSDDPRRHGLALDVLSQIIEELRDEHVVASLSTPSLTAALHHASLLATVRGRTMVSRTDLIDAVTSCFVQGDADVEGAPVLGAARRVMMGTDVGVVPPGTGRPPIALDFDRQAKAHKLPIDTTTPTQVGLDIYRSDAHRERSRLLHQLRYLEIAFGVRVSGPSYRHRRHDLTRETWQCRFTPTTDATLVVASKWGPTIESAATAKFIAELANTDTVASAGAAARQLMLAAQLGIGAAIPRVLSILREQASNDADPTSVCEALTEVSLLWSARQALSGRSLQEVPEITRDLHRRACYLFDTLIPPDSAAIPDLTASLLRLRDATLAGEWAELDPSLFWATVMRVGRNQGPELTGVADGLTWSAGRLSDDDLAQNVAGHLHGSGEPGYIQGLLAAAREALWQVPDVITALTGLLRGWTEEEFRTQLPMLRSAFAQLTPRETDRIAEAASTDVDADIRPARVNDTDETAVLANLAESDVVAALLADHGVPWATT